MLSSVLSRWHQPHRDDLLRHRDALRHCRHLRRLEVRPQTSNQHRSFPDLQRWPSLLPLNLPLPQRLNDSGGLVLDEPGRPGTHRDGNALHRLHSHQDQQPLVPGAPEDNRDNHTEFIKSCRHRAWPGSNSPICRGEYAEVWCCLLPKTVHF